MKKVIVLFTLALLTLPTIAEDQTPDRSYWGWNLGGVVTELPVSQAIKSGFAVFMADVYYSRYLTSPTDNFRVASTLGLYGFNFIIPVPRIGLDVLVGKPSDEIQFKANIGGHYDLILGGHAGLSVGLGVVLNNRFDIGFQVVPIGIDSKRDYLYMAGQRNEELDCTDKDPCVETPYFGLFVGMHY